MRIKVISTEKTVRLNDDIRAPEIRLISAEGEQLGVVSRKEALEKASEAELDLVEIAPNAEPPVCKIMDYGKFLYQLSKKDAAAKKKQKRVEIKKLRLRPGIEIGDYQVKLRNLIRFLKDGAKVEISLRFKGRELSHKEIGMALLNRIKADLEEYADIEREPGFEGRQMIMIVVPKKVTKEKA